MYKTKFHDFHDNSMMGVKFPGLFFILCHITLYKRQEQIIKWHRTLLGIILFSDEEKLEFKCPDENQKFIYQSRKKRCANDIQNSISITKFHDFSMIFHHFSNSMTFPCKDFFFSHFPCFLGFPESLGTLQLPKTSEHQEHIHRQAKGKVRYTQVQPCL